MKFFERFFMWASGASLAVVFCVTFFQVIQRYIFSMPLPWATDIIRISFIYSVFCGMCVGVIRKKHLDIDVLLQILPQKARRAFDILSNCIVIFFLGTVMRYSISFIQANTDQTTPYLLYPMSYIYAVFPITIIVMIVALLCDIRKIVTSKKEDVA